MASEAVDVPAALTGVALFFADFFAAAFGAAGFFLAEAGGASLSVVRGHPKRESPTPGAKDYAGAHLA